MIPIFGSLDDQINVNMFSSLSHLLTISCSARYVRWINSPLNSSQHIIDILNSMRLVFNISMMNLRANTTQYSEFSLICQTFQSATIPQYQYNVQVPRNIFSQSANLLNQSYSLKQIVAD